jgi:type I restriction enzyme S subunit
MAKDKLPQSWVLAKVEEMVKKIPLTGKKLKRSEYQENGKLPVIDQGQVFIGGYTDKKKLKVDCESPVIIFGDHTKVVKYINFDFVAGADGVKVIKPIEVFNPKLFYYFVQTVKLPDKGYARHFQYLEKSFIPVPPLNEQLRIVAKIEELFTRLDAGVEALKKIKAQLKRYRQAVLKYAFEGKLTEKWREKHKNELESASVLLERIKKEKSLRGAKRQSKLKDKDEIASPHEAARNDTMPELPEGWVWARLREIGEIVTGTTPSKAKKEYYGNDYPFFKPSDLNAGYYVKSSDDKLSDDGMRQARLLPEKSILVTCIGATIGKIGFNRVQGASNQQINTIIPVSGIIPEFIYFNCISTAFQRSIINNASATTLPILNKSKFELLHLPFASLNEQHQIVEEIERRFSMVDEVEKVVEQSLKQAERLRQSILKTAFEGKLVPQDPNDEPAEKLLERIKSEKAQCKTAKKPSRVIKSSQR